MFVLRKRIKKVPIRSVKTVKLSLKLSYGSGSKPIKTKKTEGAFPNWPHFMYLYNNKCFVMERSAPLELMRACDGSLEPSCYKNDHVMGTFRIG